MLVHVMHVLTSLTSKKDDKEEPIEYNSVKPRSLLWANGSIALSLLRTQGRQKGLGSQGKIRRRRAGKRPSPHLAKVLRRAGLEHGQQWRHEHGVGDKHS